MPYHDIRIDFMKKAIGWGYEVISSRDGVVAAGDRATFRQASDAATTIASQWVEPASDISFIASA